jgi:hypothetical protein
MLFTISHYIEYIIANRFEISPSIELVWQRLLFIIRFLEGEKATKHVHNRFFSLPLVDSSDALFDSLDLCGLSQVHVVLELCSKCPGQH